MDLRGERLLHERVARGVALLDSRVPGWDQEIEVEDLDLGNTDYCVIGQAAELIIKTVAESAVRREDLLHAQRVNNGAYGLGLAALGLTFKKAISYGFDESSAVRHSYGYHELTEAWCDVLATRRLDRQLATSLAAK